MTAGRLPPETSPAVRRLARAALRPVERFLRLQAASGISLLVAAVVAMAWANSPWREAYHHLWETPLGFAFAGFTFQKTLHFWINDGLMAVFFFVVGLEIRREIHAGELSDLKRAVLPLAAALGGMVAPALIYVGFTGTYTDLLRGWGTPMATDIAFAVGVLALLGDRVPPALRILLLALAVIDDIGAVLVIALFYSSGVQLGGVAIGAAGVAGIALFQRLGVRQAIAYVLPSAVVWAGAIEAGVHPTIAGVIVGLMTPVRSWFGEDGFLAESKRAIAEFAQRKRQQTDSHDLVAPLDRIDRARREALPPVVRLETAFGPWVSYGVMPLFALANAGVTLGDIQLGAAGSWALAAGIGLGLLIGKPLGIVAASLTATRMRLATLPRGVDFKGLLVVGLVGGVGFTMALFIANLAFADPARLGVAKVAVLAGSLAAGVAGLSLGAAFLSSELPEGAATTASHAEQSSEV